MKPCISFGKNKGRQFRKIDTGYLKWFVQADNETASKCRVKYPDDLIHAAQELDRRLCGDESTPFKMSRVGGVIYMDIETAPLTNFEQTQDRIYRKGNKMNDLTIALRGNYDYFVAAEICEGEDPRKKLVRSPKAMKCQVDQKVLLDTGHVYKLESSTNLDDVSKYSCTLVTSIVDTSEYDKDQEYIRKLESQIAVAEKTKQRQQTIADAEKRLFDSVGDVTIDGTELQALTTKLDVSAE